MRIKTLRRELRALNGKNDSRSSITKTTLGRELRALNGKNDSRS